MKRNVMKVSGLLALVAVLLVSFFLYAATCAADDMTSTSTLNESQKFIIPVSRQNDVPDGWVGVYTASDLHNIRNNPSGKYILMNNVELSIMGEWSPINNFTGVLDGNGYVIHNLLITEASDAMTNNGLFSNVNGGTIRNLGMEEVYINVKGVMSGGTNDRYLYANIGAIAGNVNSAIIENCYGTGSVSAFCLPSETFNYRVGGIVGYSGDSLLINCSNFSTISTPQGNWQSTTGNRRDAIAGGIVGYDNNLARIENCRNSGPVTSTGIAGGIIGQCRCFISTQDSNDSFNINDCSNTGQIISSVTAGGIVGYAYFFCDSATYNRDNITTRKIFSIERCYNTGNVYVHSSGSGSGNSVTARVGGIIGYLYSYISNVSYNNSSGVNNSVVILRNCYNSGIIQANAINEYSSAYSYVGGIVGDFYSYTDSSRYDSASSRTAATVEVSRCYNTGDIFAEAFGRSGGIAGSLRRYFGTYNGGVNNSTLSVVYCAFIDKTAIATGLNDGWTISNTTARSAAQLRQQNSFPGFDFSGIWGITEGLNTGYPYLRNVPTQTDAESVTEAASVLWAMIKKTNITQNAIKADLDLVQHGAAGTVVTWDSSDPDVISVEGIVTLPTKNNTDVMLTATINKGEEYETVIFHINVIPLICSYTVIFVDHDGSILDTQEIEYESAATAPTEPTRTGYTFAGWDKDYSNITSDMTVTALYNINNYTVKFIDWDGTLLKTHTAPYGASVPAPDDPVREGYTFTSWDEEFSIITSDLMVTAQYKINMYAVTFISDGAEFNRQTVEHGSAATDPGVPIKTNYTFSGWDVDFSNITGDLTIIALFTANLMSAAPMASVEKLSGNQNNLTITVTERYSDETTKTISVTFIINNNAAAAYNVGSYKVYVDTKGNTQIRECYIMK